MSGMKRTVGWLLSLALLLSMLPAAVLSTAAKGTLYDLLYDGLMETRSEIDVADVRKSEEEVNATFQRLIFEKPELFFVNLDYEFRRSADGSYVTEFYPQYTMVGGNLGDARREYQWMVSNIVEKVDSTWSDLQKLLFVHDYFNVRFLYDNTLETYDAYHFLKSGTGVCQAYVLAFRAVMDAVGVNTSWAHSADMAHVWTQVELDGEWYNLDMTWDDAVPDMYGRARHDYFLLSDAAMQAEGYHDWVSDHACTSTRFETGALWEDVTSPFVCMNDVWYCVKDATIYSCDFATGEQTAVQKLACRWSAGEGKYWKGSYTGLSTYDGRLYFNTPTALCSYDPATDTLTEMVAISGESGEIYGSYLQNDKGSSKVVMHYEIATSPNLGGHVAYGAYELHEHEWDEGVEQTPATCSSEGEMLYTCGKCGARATLPIEKTAHTHAEEWTTDESGHWHACVCGDKADEAEHTFDWVIDTPATEETEGERHEACTVCGFVRSEGTKIPVLGHVHTLTHVEEQAPTADAAGVAEHWYCADCETYFADADGAQEITQEDTVLPIPVPAVPGDVNGDEAVNTTDARLVLQYAVNKIGADALDLSVADVNKDGQINTTDARLILQFAVGKIENFA